MSNLISYQELEALKATKNPIEWDSVCDVIKAAHNGYPSDWWTKVMSSGLANSVIAGWTNPDLESVQDEIDDVVANDFKQTFLSPNDTGLFPKVLDEKEFLFEDVLSVTSGKLLNKAGSMKCVHDIMHYMMGGGEPLTNTEVQIYAYPVADAICEQHPFLKEIDVAHLTPSNFEEELTMLINKYGSTILLKSVQ